MSNMVIIGAGPAGLTAAYELSKHNLTGVILESDSVVGGIARTVERDGYRFDIGGHRFFTKVAEIENLWDEILDEPMLVRPRLSRIFYDGKFYDYPLKASNALKNMGLLNAGACMLSYFAARVRPIANPVNFEQWVTNQFGGRLFNMFFKSYTEKVWGTPCTQIGADWAAQRIKGLSLGEAVRNSILGQREGGKIVKTLIDEFRYPRLGPGQLWEACARKVQKSGWRLRLQTRVTHVELRDGAVVSVRAVNGAGVEERFQADQVFSTMPLRHLLGGMNPSPPASVLNAAAALTYRDFLTVALVLDRPGVFPDNWIYIHSPEVRVARIQNFGNWSPAMLADPATSCVGMEYFVNDTEKLWSATDDALVKFAYAELRRIGLSRGGGLVKGFVVRMPKAYPVYDPGYRERLDLIRQWLSAIPNLHCMGRNGQHRYNNQDHSMATALIAARNVAMSQSRDPWAVNEDAMYHEIARTERAAPITPAVGGAGALGERAATNPLEVAG
ncbi:MAG TPA: NAD(P)/FAD-dependent oxidoreductase [Tepidisphaeraceae bacterium]|nr:NAD(P)/FAD-dependent oxidoreductase [Tepidisphaeraceae bacterium]